MSSFGFALPLRCFLLSTALAWLAAPVLAESQKYQRDLDEISVDVRAGDAAAAEKVCTELPERLCKMTLRLPANVVRPTSSEFLAELLARCAVAALREGDEALASWRWHAAQAFSPNVAAATAKEMGAYAELPRPRRRGEGVSDLVKMSPLGLPSGVPESSTLQPPKPISTPPMVDLSSHGGSACRVIIETLLGPDGRPRQPALVANSPCNPLQAFEFFEVLGTWRFEPARDQNGDPIEVSYTLTATAGGH